ncbi:hypothetical protein [Streptomyces sp. AC555_RSS877]|uniref:hypothetical protein n=1 Tax=Streptomyces sp. AC555_RSS877 TaxID=2823688 RepID=UPI001C262AC2|nr:hypothetical protein [Streptomyces sp. AC555_RSS877]
MQEDDWCYDNGEELSSGFGPEETAGEVLQQWMEVDRVYCVAWQQFTSADWDTLGQIYRDLPGWQPFSSDVPRWYSLDEDRNLHLWASIEPSGLMVAGVLTQGMWRDWDTQFRHAITSHGLPRFKCA